VSFVLLRSTQQQLLSVVSGTFGDFVALLHPNTPTTTQLKRFGRRFRSSCRVPAGALLRCAVRVVDLVVVG